MAADTKKKDVSSVNKSSEETIILALSDPLIVMGAIILTCLNWVNHFHIKIIISDRNNIYNFAPSHLVLSTLAAAVFAYHIPVFREAISIDNVKSIGISMLLSICLPFALYIQRNKFPINIYLLGIFTTVYAMTIGVAIRMYGAGVVLDGSFLIFVITSIVIEYVFQTTRDLTKTNAGLLVIFVVLLGLAMMNIGGSIIIDCLFIVFQTQMKMMKFSLHHYVKAVLDLFSNILVLFWELRGLLLGKSECQSCNNTC